VTTKTTMNLKLATQHAARQLDQIPAALLVAIAVLFAAAGIATIGRLRSAPSVAAVPTPGLIILIATEPAVVVPTAVPPAAQVAYQQPIRYVTAWAAPDGVVLGPIPWSSDSPILGRWAETWLMTSWEGGNVWVRAADLGASLANLAPAPAAPAPQVIYQVVNQPAQPAPQAPAVAQPEQPGYQAVQAAPAPQVAPAATPAPAMSTPTDVQRTWAAEQWREEHQVGNSYIP
jgi:hypothetical protein